MRTILSLSSLVSLLFCGAIFGFFYAWICSTMWGLDNAEPAVAIKAMQAMNASVRNGVFAPAFFGTPMVLGITAVIAWMAKEKLPSLCFAFAGAFYFCFGLVLTMMINVPMNEALALVEVTSDSVAMHMVWTDYSAEWQFWNVTRTIASGTALLVCGYGVLKITPQA